MHRHLRPPEEQIQQAEFSSWVQTATPTTIIPALVRILDGNLNFVDYPVFSRRQSAKKTQALHSWQKFVGEKNVPSCLFIAAAVSQRV